MINSAILLGLLTCLSLTHVHTSTVEDHFESLLNNDDAMRSAGTAANPQSNSNSTKHKHHHHSKKSELNKFTVHADIDQDPENYGSCRTKIGMDGRDRSAIIGSKGYAISAMDKSKRLVCKSKAFRIRDNNGVILRVAADVAAALSENTDLEALLKGTKTETKNMEVASKSGTAMAPNCHERDIISAVENQAEKAGTTSVSKTKMTHHGMESIVDTHGRAVFDKKGKKLRSWGKEVTKLVTRPPRDAGNFVASSLVHNERTKFEMDI